MNSLQRYVGLLLKHRRFLFWEVLIVTVVTILYSLVAAPAFTSSAQILPPTSDETSIMSLPSLLGSSGLSNLSRLGSSLRGTQSSDLVAAILSSRTVRERVMDSCDFMKAYKQKSRELAVRLLGKLTKIKVTEEGIVALSVEAGSASLATRLASNYVSELDRFLRESNMSRGRSQRIFLERRLVDAQAELGAAQESLTVFQKLNRVTAVDDETKAAVESYAKLQAQKMASDVELEFARDLAGPSNPYVLNLQQQNLEFDHQLSKLEVGGRPGSGFGVGAGVPLKGVPDVAAEYMRRLAEYKLRLELLALLDQQYEEARITEVRDTPAITVLDPPRLPEKRSFPKRTMMTITAFVLSLFVGVMLSFVLEFWEGQRHNPQAWREWQRIWTVLKQEARLAIRPFGQGRRRPGA